MSFNDLLKVASVIGISLLLVITSIPVSVSASPIKLSSVENPSKDAKALSAKSFQSGVLKDPIRVVPKTTTTTTPAFPSTSTTAHVPKGSTSTTVLKGKPRLTTSTTKLKKPTTTTTISQSQQSRVYGVTIDDIENTSAIVNSLAKLPRRPTVRVVFDEDVEPNYYKSALRKIEPHAEIMGELLDSYYVKDYSTVEYKQRAQDYLQVLGEYVDIWEIGNEINGEWLGSTSDVIAKLNAAYEVIDGAGKKTALTLYYNYECWETPDHEMFHWAETYVSAKLKNNLDYVFVSYYEDDCNGYQPNTWAPVFTKVHQLFPSSLIGFGEIGTTKSGQKADHIKRYYSMKIDVPNFVGGYFWWYFYQDMVPATKPLWSVLADTWAKY